MKRFLSIFQAAVILLALAWLVDTVTRRADVVFTSPFPQSSPEVGFPVAFVFLFVGVVIYILSAFRLTSYWQRLYRVLLFIGITLGVHFLFALAWPAHPVVLVYAVAGGITVLNFTKKYTITHTAAQFLLISGVTVWAASRITPFQAILLLGLFSLYDLLAGFFPRQMFDAVSKFFRVDHLVSLVVPDTFSGWFKSHHDQSIAIRSLDVIIPLLFAALVAFPIGSATYWFVVTGWLGGMVLRFRLPYRLQYQLIVPALCAFVGYLFSLL
jgi:hypothetical protein